MRTFSCANWEEVSRANDTRRLVPVNTKRFGFAVESDAKSREQTAAGLGNVPRSWKVHCRLRVR